MTDLVTCIVPVHNGERYLGEAIDSILAQTHRPLEVIVVDNGSTDGSAALAESYGEPVRVIRQRDQGPPGGRNTGIRAARGDLLAFLDADDRYHPDKLAIQVERFRARPAIEVCLCVAENFWEPGLEEEEARYTSTGKTHAVYTFGTMLARRSVFSKVGLLDPALTHGDYVDWFARLKDSGVDVDVIPDVLVARRMHPASLSHAAPQADAYLQILKDTLDRRRQGLAPG